MRPSRSVFGILSLTGLSLFSGRASLSDVTWKSRNVDPISGSGERNIRSRAQLMLSRSSADLPGHRRAIKGRPERRIRIPPPRSQGRFHTSSSRRLRKPDRRPLDPRPRPHRRPHLRGPITQRTASRRSCKKASNSNITFLADEGGPATPSR